MEINDYGDLLNDIKARYGDASGYENLTPGDKLVLKECLRQYRDYFQNMINVIDEWENVFGRAEDALKLN